MGERREELLYEYILPTTMVTAWGIFIFFKETFGFMRFPQKQMRLISSISGCTLGIYLFHDLVLQIFLLLGISSLTFNPLFSIPLISLSVFAISLPFIQLIRKIPILGNYVV
jgi:surface polysaccharide O-acyltransferase-like enzyme